MRHIGPKINALKSYGYVGFVGYSPNAALIRLALKYGATEIPVPPKIAKEVALSYWLGSMSETVSFPEKYAKLPVRGIAFKF